MSDFFVIGTVLINSEKLINISKKLIKHDKKEKTDDNGEPYKSAEQYAIVIKQEENNNSYLYYDSKEEQEAAFNKLIDHLVWKKAVRS